jgi:hypothetical protein
MHATQIEKRHVKIYSGGQMFQRFAKSKTEPSEAAEVRSHAQVGAFDVASGYSFELRVSADWNWDGGDNLRGVVPLGAFGISFPIDFEQLCEINVRSEVFLNRRPVGVQAIGCYLESSRDALAQIAHEVKAISGLALANKVGQNHFCFAVYCHPDVAIAPLFGYLAMQMAFFGMHESPKLVGLHEIRVNISDALIEKIATLVSNSQEQVKNRFLMYVRNARDGADTHTFQQQSGDLSGFLCRDTVASERSAAGFGECSFTTGTAETLDSVASVESELLYFGVLALDASHGLLFLREKPYNQAIGSECGLRPRLDLARLLALTRGRAFSFLRNCSASRSRNLLCSRGTLICEPVSRAASHSNFYDVALSRKSGDSHVHAPHDVPGSSQPVYDFTTRHGLIVSQHFLREQNQEHSITNRTCRGRERNDSSVHSHYAVQRKRPTVLTLALRFFRQLRFLAWLFWGRRISNQTLKDLELSLNDIGRPFRLELLVPNFYSEFVFVHIQPQKERMSI